MSAVPYIAMEMVATGERAAQHPVVSILIACGLLIAVHLFFRSINAYDRRNRGE